MDAMVVLTGVLVVITAGYAYLTHRMAKASETSVRLMKEQADAITRPYVVVLVYATHSSLASRRLPTR